MDHEVHISIFRYFGNIYLIKSISFFFYRLNVYMVLSIMSALFSLPLVLFAKIGIEDAKSGAGEYNILGFQIRTRVLAEIFYGVQIFIGSLQGVVAMTTAAYLCRALCCCRRLIESLKNIIPTCLFKNEDTGENNIDSCCNFESHFLFTGNTRIKFKNKELQEILSQFIEEDYNPVKSKRDMIIYEKQFRKICQNLNLHLGSATIETDIFRGITSVIQRDFGKDFNADKFKIFVPKIFLSKYPKVIDYENYIKKIDELKVIHDINDLGAKVLIERDPTKKEKMTKALEDSKQKMRNNEFYTQMKTLEEEEVKMVKSLPSVRGEKAEKKIYETLENYFSNSNEEILVLYNFMFMGLLAAKDYLPEEKDFIIINLTKRYIMPLEVKTNFNMTSLKKAMKQIKNAIELINDWLGGDLKEGYGWRFIPVVCFESEIPDIAGLFCSVDINYIFHGKDIDAQLKKMLHEIPTPGNTQNNQEGARKQFKKICEYMIFFACFEQITTPSMLPKKVSELVREAGKAKIIEMYRCYTPNQLPLLRGYILKVLFMAAPSTGKTTLMEEKAFQYFEMGKNVLFVIPYGYQNKIKTLLGLKMQQKWNSINEEYGRINKFHVKFVKTIWSSSRRNLTVDYDDFSRLILSDQFKDSEVFADELSVYNTEELQQLLTMATTNSERSTWLAITGMRQNRVNPDKIKFEFEKNGFYIPKLVNPLRNSSTIVEFAYPNIKGMLRGSRGFIILCGS